MESKYIDEPHVYPSRTGKDVIDFERYAHLPRATTYTNVQGFLETARKSKEVNVLFIEAEWGEGKTSIYEGLLQKTEVIKSDVVVKVNTSTLITVIQERSQDFRDIPIIGVRLFASLLLAIRGVLESKVEKKSLIDKIKILDKSADTSTINFIEENLKRISEVIPSTSKLFIFLDEFEDIVDQPSDIQSFITGGLVDIINGQPEHLCKGDHAGRIHLIIAVTPTAYATIKSKVHSNIGRLFGQRAFEVSLEKLTRKYAYDFIQGYFNYCWNGKIPKLPVTHSGMINAIYNATFGNPRAIMTVLEILLSKAKNRAPEGKIELISPRNFTQDLSGTKISVYGADVCLLDKQSFNALHIEVEEETLKWKLDKEKAKTLLDLLIANHSPISEDYIKKELGIGDKYSTYLNIIGKAFEKLWNIRGPFLFFNKVIEGEEEVYSKAKSSTSKFLSIIDAAKFYEYDEETSTFSHAIFVPNRSLNDLKLENETMFRNFIEYFRSLIPDISDEDEVVLPIDAEILPKINKSKEDYVMLAPPALSILYPPPSVIFLDFIEDVDKRFEIGTEIMRDTTSFEEHFQKGVTKLLKDGCHRVLIEEGYEHYGAKSVQIHNIKYKMLGEAEECKFRSYLFHKLSWGLEKTNEELAEEVKRMELANIPLLLIFTWNPIPTEIRASIETFLPRKIMHFIEFPLTTIQTYQLIALDVAEDRKYKVKEERWKVRARRIMEEIKFEDILEEWIHKGYNEGYTVKPLIFKGGIDNLPKALRTFLILEGRSIKESFEFLKNVEGEFKIHGTEFGINPLDIESPTQLKEYAEELENYGFLKLDGKIDTKITPVENRILEILKHYKKGLSNEEFERFFVISGVGKIRPYLNALLERKLLGLIQGDMFGIIDLKDLEKRAQEYKVSLDKLKKHYENHYLGYLVSVKQKAVHSIVALRCVDDLLELYKELEKKRFKDDHAWRMTYLHFELLKKHIDRIDELIQEFDKTIEGKRKGIDIESIKRGLLDLEKSIPNYFPEVGKTVRIDEKKKLEEKDERIKEVRNAKYSDEELREKGKQFADKKEELRNEGLAETYKGCPVFDVKAVVLSGEYGDLKKFIESCNIDDVNDKLKEYDKLRKQINEHELFKLKFDNKDSPFSYLLLEWTINNITSASTKKRTTETTVAKEEIILKLNEIKSLIDRNTSVLKDQVTELGYFNTGLKELQTKELSFNHELLSAKTNLEKLSLFFEGEATNKISISLESLRTIEKEREKKRGELHKKIKQKFEKSIFMQYVGEYKKFFEEKIPEIHTFQNEARSEFKEKVNILHEKLSMISRLLSSIKKTSEGT